MHPSRCRTRQVLPNVKLVQVYGLSETGFLTGCWITNTPTTSSPLADACLGIDVRSDQSGMKSETGQTGELVARGANIMRS